MKVALFDDVVSPRSPAGSCDMRVLQALRDEHEITVFASEFALPDRGRPVRQIAVPTVRQPALASFLLYLALACISYARLRLRGRRWDVIQATDCSFPVADVCYAHFCHKAFLLEVWPRMRAQITPRVAHSWASHAVRALIEARLVRRARVIVVPSEGLRRELARVYPGVGANVIVIHNTVDLAHFQKPSGFDRRDIRARMRADDSHAVFVFVALGHFERKGLPILLEAISMDDAEFEHARVWVVGGEPGLVASYRRTAERLGIASKVAFAGKTEDVRPFLWGADAFVAPSHYEAFSLGLLEAAAAGLPLIATRISGSEELLEHGVNGFEVEGTLGGVAAGLRSFINLNMSRRAAMGRAARESIEPLRPERFAAAWRDLYASLSS